MAVKIRLTRVGRHKRPFYRIVAADSQSPRDGKSLEILGYYDPQNVTALKVNETRAIDWLNRGAEVSDTARSIFSKLHLFQKASDAKIKPVKPDAPEIQPEQGLEQA